MDVAEILHMISSDFKDLRFMRAHTPNHVGEFFLKLGIKKQVALLSLLLLDKNMHNYIQKSDIHSLLHWSVKKIYDTLTVNDVPDDTLPYEIRIEKLNVPEIVKKKAREKLKEIKGSRENSEKAIKYLDGLLRIPFGIYRLEPIICFKSEFLKKLSTPVDTEAALELAIKTESEAIREEWLTFKANRKKYLDYVSETLESCMYGQQAAKRSIKSIIAQWINGEHTGAVLGFQGYPGTGKTSLAKHGIAQCIKDEKGNPRPFFFISLGGSKGGSSLLGHSYTYVGSQCGKLAECLQNGKVMNPILYFDELDKVSESSCGEEIIRILTHLTDPEQNDHIEDRYFGIDMDLSKALLIFSYNNSRKIDSILMDRIHEIKFKAYNRIDKTHIARKYLIPKILKSLGHCSQSIIFTDEVVTYIIDKYTCESGVRDMKEKITHIARDVNLRRIYNEDQYKIPFTITNTLVDDILKSVNKVRLPYILQYPQVGIVHGLYATDVGTGGLTIIQVSPAPSDKKFHIELTGNLGDVMKESVMCAKTISWAILPESDRTWGSDALHIHFPSAGTNKDGPSAGAAITLAVVSYFSKLPVRNDIALTGEIDIHGNILPIGGLDCKLEGAEKAGIKTVLIPRGNEQELHDIDLSSLTLSVVPVDNIMQVICKCLIGYDSKDFNFNTIC
jgi:ATP-dependent Lon protease